MIDHFAEKEEETCLNIDVNPFLYVYAFYLCEFGKPWKGNMLRKFG